MMMASGVTETVEATVAPRMIEMMRIVTTTDTVVETETETTIAIADAGTMKTRATTTTWVASERGIDPRCWNLQGD